MSYKNKKTLIYTFTAITSIILVIILCVFLILAIYGPALFSSKDIQLKKAEHYAMLSSSTQKGGVVFIGDSIFEMYDLDENFKDKGYINRGISSNESKDVLDRLQTNLIDIAPKIVIIHVGVNDIGHGVSSSDYIKNMDLIIEKIATSLPDTHIFIDSIYPTLELNNINSHNLTKTRNNSTILNTNAQLVNLCNTKSEYNVKFIDTHKVLLSNNALNKKYTIDGLHLNEEGYKAISKEFARHINNVSLQY